MILFVTAHDEATSPNAEVADLFIDSLGNDCIAFIGKRATRDNLIGAISGQTQDIFVMSHGDPRRIIDQESNTALGLDDLHLLCGARVYAFACHTGTDLGGEAVGKNITWWGYEGPIQSIKSCDLTAPLYAAIFEFIADQVGKVVNREDAEKVVNQIYDLCQNKIRQIHYMERRKLEISVLSESRTLTQMWARLRIWLPDTETPIKHVSATTWTGPVRGLL